MMIDAFLTAFLIFFVVVDPLGNIPLFLAVTQHMPRRQVQRTALEASAIAFSILLVFALIGHWLITYLGVSIHAFKVAGGIILFRLALEMLASKRQDRKQQEVARRATSNNASGDKTEHHDHSDDSVSIFPLAIPLLAGPSAIASVMVVFSDFSSSWIMQGVGGAALVAVMLITAVVFYMAASLRPLIDTRLLAVFSRIMAVILAALSVQFVLDGLASLGVVALVSG